MSKSRNQIKKIKNVRPIKKLREKLTISEILDEYFLEMREQNAKSQKM